MDRSQQFDFDTWAELAKSDPAAFERQRTDAIEEFLRQVPGERRQRLRCLQWRIDHTRERAANPMSACLRISQMMWDSLLGDGGLLEALERLRRPCSPTVARPRAKVLDFRRGDKD